LPAVLKNDWGRQKQQQVSAFLLTILFFNKGKAAKKLHQERTLLLRLADV